MLNSDDILSKLREIQQEIKNSDPLLQRGIETDWVCVIHPRMKEPVLAQAPPPSIFYDVSFPLETRLARVTGRETYIINDAPDDRIEYMPKVEMYRRYKAHFQRTDRYLYYGNIMDDTNPD